MKYIKNNLLMMALFAALAINAIGNFADSYSIRIAETDLASTGSICDQKIINGIKTLDCNQSATYQEKNLSKKYFYKTKIEEVMVNESELRGWNQSDTEAGIDVDSINAFFTDGAGKPTPSKVKAYKVIIERKDCDCYTASAVIRAGKDIQVVLSAVNSEISRNAKDSYKKDEAALKIAEEEKAKAEELKKKQLACEADSKGEDITKANRRSERVDCIVSRLDSMDEKEAKSFWADNKKIVKRHFTDKDTDREDINNIAESLFDAFDNLDLVDLAHSVNAMRDGALAQKDMMDLTQQLYMAKLTRNGDQEQNILRLMSSLGTRFSSVAGTYPPGSAAATEALGWQRDVALLGQRAASSPEMVLREYDPEFTVSNSNIAMAIDYQNALGVSPQGFQNSINGIGSTLPPQRTTPVAPFQAFTGAAPAATQVTPYTSAARGKVKRY